MRWFRGMAMVLVGIMLLTISGSAFAAVKDDTVSPLYLYTRKVKASLTISDSGKATCVGHIKANNMKSDISMTVTLYNDEAFCSYRPDGDHALVLLQHCLCCGGCQRIWFYHESQRGYRRLLPQQ